MKWIIVVPMAMLLSILKLTHHLACSWAVITAPLWGNTALLIFIFGTISWHRAHRQYGKK